MRQLVHGLTAALALGVAAAAQAQTDFPSRPMKVLVGFPAGSTADIIARLLAASEETEKWARVVKTAEIKGE